MTVVEILMLVILVYMVVQSEELNKPIRAAINRLQRWIETGDWK